MDKFAITIKPERINFICHDTIIIYFVDIIYLCFSKYAIMYS